jgi:hypothetical protein
MMAIAGGAKALLGAGQMLFAPKKQKEPVYEIPKEVGEAVTLGRSMGSEGMAEAQRMSAVQNIQQSAVMGMRGAQDRRSGLAAIGNIQAQQDRSALSIMAQDAAMRQQNQRFMYSALMAGAEAKNREFSNRWQSWMNKEQQRRALIGAGIQNIGGAADLVVAGSMYGGGGSSSLGADKGGLSKSAIGSLSGGGSSSGLSMQSTTSPTFGITNVTGANGRTFAQNAQSLQNQEFARIRNYINRPI